jgi:hypothetical protein
VYRLRFTGLILLICGCLISTSLTNAAVTADWGDVVIINYSLYLDAARQPQDGLPGNVDVDIENLYLTAGSSPPPRIVEAYPGAELTFLDQFTAAFVGMEVNEEKSFVINSTEHPYGNELEGKDLFYDVVLLAIVYDVSEETTTTTDSSPIPPPDFGFLLAAGAGVSLLVGGVLLRGYRASQRMESAMSDKPVRDRRQDEVLRKERSQLQELRELTETISDPQDKPQDKDPAKIRRRR